MITIILFAIIGLICSIRSFWEDFDFSFEEFFGNFIGSLCIIIVAAGFGLGVAFLLPMKTKTSVETYKIVCLQDNNSSSSTFFLGTGYIKGDMKYVFYYESNQEYKMKLTSVENTIIKYSDTIKCERYYKVIDESIINYFALDDNFSERSMKYIIYVPKGTIKQNFMLDAQ